MKIDSEKATLRNIFACLVHEKLEIVLDLVENLHALDPESLILLYNGGRNGRLFDGLPLARYGAVAHPTPQPLRWGWLHPFALDCMRFGLANHPFDTLTIVDSDQLATRPGYTRRLAQFLRDQPGIGLLSSEPRRQGPSTSVPPARTAHQEFHLWQPFLRRFPGGEGKFVHWSFWPATVFTADAARDLVRLFDRDQQLRAILRRTRIWASEEIILPTLVALLGYGIAANPCSHDFVRYRAAYRPAELGSALERPDVFWVHPIPRSLEDPLRQLVRRRVGEYAPQKGGRSMIEDAGRRRERGLLRTLPILAQMKRVEGWLEEDEADLLIAAAAEALRAPSSQGHDGQPAAEALRAPSSQRHVGQPAAIVEVGSYLGRATVVLGGVVRALDAEARVFAIDPHDGRVGAAGGRLQRMGPTLAGFRRNVAAAGLSHLVEPIVGRAYEVSWDRPIGLLLVDGLHDYTNVRRDFNHFAGHLVEGAYAVFHDYADYFPGVQRFVDELLAGGGYRLVALARSLVVLQKTTAAEAADVEPAAEPALADAGRGSAEGAPAVPRPAPLPAPAIAAAAAPLVSCLMPTYNRRAFVPRAIAFFLRQDYPNRELIILDDGDDGHQNGDHDGLAGLVPDDPRIRYQRLEGRLAMGAKHNLGCELARGEFIAHWDDDDWVAPWRLSYQVRALQEEPSAALCGLSTLLYYDPAAGRGWKYTYPPGRRTWVCGNTFCYRRDLWERQKHPAISEGADTRYVWGLSPRLILPLPDHHFLVAIIHEHNTSRKSTRPPRWRPYPAGKLQALMGEDWPLYSRE